MNTHLRREVPCAIPFLFLVVPCLALQSAKPAIPSALEQLSDSLQAVVRKVSPSIVKIEVSGYTRSEQDGDEDSPRSQRGAHILTRTHSIGSGVILDSDGYIITKLMCSKVHAGRESLWMRSSASRILNRRETGRASHLRLKSSVPLKRRSWLLSKSMPADCRAFGSQSPTLSRGSSCLR
jgi:hypothetical protein